MQVGTEPYAWNDMYFRIYIVADGDVFEPKPES